MKTFPTFLLLIALLGLSRAFSQEPFAPLDQEPEPLNYTQLIRQISYPSSAQRGGVEGLVQVLILVDERGNYVRHKIARSAHPLLSQAVDPYIACLQFQPAIYQGRTVRAWTAIPLRFRLTDLPGPNRKYEVICPETTKEAEIPIARN